MTEETINDNFLIPHRSDKEIEGFVSQENWFMFAPASICTREEAKNAPIPNVFFNLYEEDSTESGRIGLTFNTIQSVERIKNILSGYSHKEKEELKNRLLSLEGVWKITVNRKIKDNFKVTPCYEREFERQSNDINENIIDEIIATSERIREEGKENREKVKLSKKSYTETPTIDLMVCEFYLSEDEFKKRIKEAFDVLKICLRIKTDAQIKKLEKQNEKDIIEFITTKAMKCPSCGVSMRGKKISDNEARCGVCRKEFSITKDDIDEEDETYEQVKNISE